MAVECSECKAATYKVVDTETDVQGRSFVLLECEKCTRRIIVPKEDWEQG